MMSFSTQNSIRNWLRSETNFIIQAVLLMIASVWSITNESIQLETFAFALVALTLIVNCSVSLKETPLRERLVRSFSRHGL